MEHRRPLHNVIQRLGHLNAPLHVTPNPRDIVQMGEDEREAANASAPLVGSWVSETVSAPGAPILVNYMQL